jgi:hypothetical protein
MKTSFARALVIATVLIVAAGAAPAAAWNQPSVFPIPADPWSAWGRPAPGQRPSVSRVVPGAPRAVAPAPRAVWVQGFWAWNGFAWVWVPPHWSPAHWHRW